MNGRTQGMAEPEVNAVQHLLQSYHQAMIDADIKTLKNLLCIHFNLEHVTGYQQSMLEWLNRIETRYFAYHSISIDDDSPAIFVQKTTAAIIGKATFNVSICGITSPWHLQFVVRCVKQNTQWLIENAQYATCAISARHS
ncbi:nuclear transport factor 2 family protein [Alteromonas sp. a30]|uniref:nuclear transport factor 2 family protein n=1 Tax=Alteromonas sp. a30 TaxID=2730917 RepID=UPI00228289B7|nr:nuclear transport factor 2 family protein [Alteromonas sp. a30]MCY7293932.1 nuclear transport factor 2 family protein [Alteromonas sp. a30]